jgi:hypothetical protein
MVEEGKTKNEKGKTDCDARSGNAAVFPFSFFLFPSG